MKISLNFSKKFIDVIDRRAKQEQITRDELIQKSVNFYLAAMDEDSFPGAFFKMIDPNDGTCSLGPDLEKDH